MKSSGISIFRFRSLELRAVYIDGEIWVSVTDLCKGLNIIRTNNAVRSALKDEEIRYASVPTPFGRMKDKEAMRKIALTNESGVYALIMRSNKPEAKDFRQWVTGKVLPTIRKTGCYELAEAKALELTSTNERACLTTKSGIRVEVPANELGCDVLRLMMQDLASMGQLA